MSFNVAIDGPSGAGKSSVSKAVSKKLGFIYVDTGALYRTVGLMFAQHGADTELNCNIEEILALTKVEMKFVNGEQRVFLNGEDVSEKIRTPEASMMASAVSAKPEVRAFLLEMQREMAKNNNVVMDGRDIGTVVLPNAEIKIYLTASVEDRAKRRYDELIAKGQEVTFQDVCEDMIKRDYNDMNRATAPLKQADDAVLADTTGFRFEDSLNLLINIVEKGIEAIK